MKSVTMLCVMLVAAVASAGVQIVVDPPISTTANALYPATKIFTVRAVADPGDFVTSVMIQFNGPMMQRWDMRFDEDLQAWVKYDPLISNPIYNVAQTGTVRDSAFVLQGITSFLDPPAETFLVGTPLEDQNQATAHEIGGAAGNHYWYGKGTMLGDPSGEGLTFTPTGQVTSMVLAQIVMDAADYPANGIRMSGGLCWKNLQTGVDATGPLTGWIGVPEPASISLLAIGAVAALIRRRRA